jgi:hypothetical protein
MLTLLAWSGFALVSSLVVGLVIVRWMPLTAPVQAANDRQLPLGGEEHGRALPASGAGADLRTL